MSKNLPQTSRSLPIALLRARERVMGPIRGVLTDAGVTEQQWRVLRVLQEEGPQEPTQIAERACLLLPSLTRILKKLEDSKLIMRRPDTKDRRRQIVEISENGLQIIDANLAEMLELAEHTRSLLGAEQHEKLLDLLVELHQLEG
ncbi:homoprotocatechuate degradation operon regulator HpaR [Ruegeria sp. SCSIO 43209]|uniref:homoprotocatechuate degradation operon regulator HpaR n=1 Tax=Ruegeria sp. SCSIO 43209 TaxID=2793010 RepID=UPI00147B211E|nr:homoprotocatechuate degradation operon regulator HpaR [Ruegeria sp. SCSIO 43209]UAB88716.1 homoprotocatechuate degradation operon regulator HpaR [Ruegeria sp. SCSIO 43209]